MELDGFGTLSDPKGNINITSMFALGKNHGKQSNTQGLTRHRITDPNEMGVKHDVGLYAMLGHDDFCKMMLMVCAVH